MSVHKRVDPFGVTLLRLAPVTGGSHSFVLTQALDPIRVFRRFDANTCECKDSHILYRYGTVRFPFWALRVDIAPNRFHAIPVSFGDFTPEALFEQPPLASRRFLMTACPGIEPAGQVPQPVHSRLPRCEVLWVGKETRTMLNLFLELNPGRFVFDRLLILLFLPSFGLALPATMFRVLKWWWGQMVVQVLQQNG